MVARFDTVPAPAPVAQCRACGLHEQLCTWGLPTRAKEVTTAFVQGFMLGREPSVDPHWCPEHQVEAEVLEVHATCEGLVDLGVLEAHADPFVGG